MTYTIDISSAISNTRVQGTGFWGNDFSSKEELKSILNEYLFSMDEDEIIRLHFSCAKTKEAMKSYGDAEAAKGNNINVFDLLSIAKKDKFHGIYIYYRPGGWIDNNGTFKYIIEKGEKLYPQYNKKLIPILIELGIVL